MDCRTVRFLEEFARPAEQLDHAITEDLRRHCAGCPECESHHQRTYSIEATFVNAMRNITVPADGAERVKSVLRSQRRQSLARRFLRLSAGTAAAAMLLLGCWLGYDWLRDRQETLNVERISNDVFMALANPSPDSVEGWYLERGTTMTPPPDFRYSLLAYYDYADLQGKRVPLLVFTRGSEQARVFVLSQRQFDLKDAIAHGQELGSGCKAIVREHPTDKRFAYLVVFNGPSLDPFLAQTQ